ncbi:MAG: transcriptional repressor [Anaerolineales bacterium]|nr:transcriptional repressor [Anaerolineales bacterium]
MMGTLLEDAQDRLRSQGGRMTTQRRLILEALECLVCHPSAEEVFDEVRQQDPSLNLSTVYRTLRWLEQEGLVSARRFDDERRQERFDPALPAEHHHFVCSVCKCVIEFDDHLIDEGKARFEARSGCEVKSASFTLYGICSQCKNERGETCSQAEDAIYAPA